MINQQINDIQKIIIIPGNGCDNVEDANWYLYMKNQLNDFKEATLKPQNIPLEVILPKKMPDPYQAKEKIWLPFILNDLKADKNTLLVGHSSGAEAAMRLLEQNQLAGAVLVCACHTDLDNENETISGYYDRPWEWQKIKQNAGIIIQYHSSDDPFIPIDEARHVQQNLNSEYHEFKDKSHFFTEEACDDIIERIKKLLLSQIKK